MLDYMTGVIKSVQAVYKRLVWDIECEYTAVALLKFKNGSIGTLECSTTTYPDLDSTFKISGTAGTITLGNNGFFEVAV